MRLHLCIFMYQLCDLWLKHVPVWFEHVLLCQCGVNTCGVNTCGVITCGVNTCGVITCGVNTCGVITCQCGVCNGDVVLPDTGSTVSQAFLSEGRIGQNHIGIDLPIMQ